MFFERRPKAENLSGARNSVAKKTKMINKKKQYDHDDDDADTCQIIHFLVKVFTFFSLFQPPKTFPHVLHYPNLSNILRIFVANKIFFSKQNYSFFFYFFLFFFRIFFFCLNSTTTGSFFILLTKQTKNTFGQSELDQ